MVQSRLAAGFDYRLQIFIGISDKRHYRINIDTAAHAGICEFLYCLKQPARRRGAGLNYPPLPFIDCCYRPDEKAVVTILAVELKVALDYCGRFCKHTIGHVVFLQYLNTLAGKAVS